jgi:hypothetical protein
MVLGVLGYYVRTRLHVHVPVDVSVLDETHKHHNGYSYIQLVQELKTKVRTPITLLRGLTKRATKYTKFQYWIWLDSSVSCSVWRWAAARRPSGRARGAVAAAKRARRRRQRGLLREQRLREAGQALKFEAKCSTRDYRHGQGIAVWCKRLLRMWTDSKRGKLKKTEIKWCPVLPPPPSCARNPRRRTQSATRCDRSSQRATP